MGQSVLTRRLIERADSAEAATSVEYAILVALVAAVIIAIVLTLGLQTANFFDLTF